MTQFYAFVHNDVYQTRMSTVNKERTNLMKFLLIIFQIRAIVKKNWGYYRWVLLGV